MQPQDMRATGQAHAATGHTRRLTQSFCYTIVLIVAEIMSTVITANKI